MPIVDGPTLDRLVKQVQEWYTETRARLIEDLERDGYPYGTVRLTQEEQLYKYLAMTPADWSSMTQRLLNKYRGQPDAMQRTSQDIKRYQERMEGLKQKAEQQQGRPLTTSMESQATTLMRQAGYPETKMKEPDYGGGPVA